MRSRSEHNIRKENEASRELAVLQEVSRDTKMTQRELASRVGLSLGVTNLLLQSLMRKGYLRMRRAAWRRWLYALTPSGMSRKLALTTIYVSRFLAQYREVRGYLSEQLDISTSNGSPRVAVYGADDLVRIVHLVLTEIGVEHVDVYVPDDRLDTFPGIAATGLSGLSPNSYDRFVVAAVNETDERCAELLDAQVPPDRMAVLFKLDKRG